MSYVPLNEVKKCIIADLKTFNSYEKVREGELIDDDVYMILKKLRPSVAGFPFHGEAYPFTCNEKMQRFSAELFRGFPRR